MGTYRITRYGHEFSIAVNDATMEDEYRSGRLAEQPMLDWIMEHVPSGGIWIDAGAYVGNHTMVFALKADAVLAFEPMARNFAALEANTAALLNVMLINKGLGGSMRLMAAREGGTGQDSQWRLTEPDAQDSGLVEVMPLDRLELGDIRLIKLDVEGMEAEAIAGALDTIGRCRPELFIEIWKQDALDRIRAVLATLGYKLIECWNAAPTFHFSASGRYPVTYKPRQLS